jgi:hypothetical protein
MRPQKTRKFLPEAESIADAGCPFQTLKSLISLNFSLGTAFAASGQGRAVAAQLGSSAMLPALGAVSAALEAFQSLTRKPSSSEPIGFSLASANPSGNSTPASGVSSGAQISPENISTLLKAQAQSLESDANSLLQDASTAFSKDASLAYNAINQLAQGQTTTFQLPSGALSINV